MSQTSSYDVDVVVAAIATVMRVTKEPTEVTPGVYSFTGVLETTATPAEPVEDETVNLVIDGATILTRNTDALGKWSFYFTLDPGATYQVKATFAGTAEYEPSETATYPVTTPAQIPTIMRVDEPPSATAEAGVPFEFFGLLQEDPSLVGISGKTVTLYIDASPVWSTTTNVTGLWTFDVVIDAPGTHTIYAEFAGDAVYLGCSEKISVARWLAPAGLLAVAGGLVGIAWLGR